jgi:hypothetical protein
MQRTFGIAVLLAAMGLTMAKTANATQKIEFDMVVSKGASACLPNAKADVEILSLGPVEVMTVDATGLPPNTGFDFFVIQVPTAPFGLSWYQGDIETNSNGEGTQVFIGRFNIETFILAPGVAKAPKVFPDNADQNPATPPVQIYHLGLWFNSRDDARKAGCPDTRTPFNGEHNAGIQVLNTSNFPNDHGPLRDLQLIECLAKRLAT